MSKSWQAEVGRALGAHYWTNEHRRNIDWSRIETSSARLTEDQKGAITEAWAMRGGVLVLRVGAGKTLISLILTRLVKDQYGYKTLLLLPANLKETVRREYRKWKSKFTIALPEMMSYSYISRNETAIDEVSPDVIIADECFYLGAMSTRTLRVVKRLEENPDTWFVGMAGTLGPFEKYSTVMEMALGDHSPVPRHGSAHTAWMHLTDSRQEVGAYEWEKIFPLAPQRIMTARRAGYQEALREHLQKSPGIYITKSKDIGTSLRIYYHQNIDLGDEVLRTIEHMESVLEVPGGDTFASDSQRVDACTQAMQGFYYSWDWGTTPEKVKLRWLHARRDISIAVGAFIEETREKTGRVLSPDQVARMDPEHLPYWLVASASRWESIKGTASPQRRQNRLQGGLGAWASTVGKNPLIWHRHVEVPNTPQLAKLPTFEESRQSELSGKRCLIQMSNAVGKNLQADWNENVLLYLPGADLMEQLMGRTHRRGQVADEVIVHVPYCHPILRKKVHNIKTGAKDAMRSKGERHKILYADEVMM